MPHTRCEDRQESYYHHTDELEIKAYIGLLYYMGLWKSSDVNDNRLWDKKNGITFYRCVFSRQRYSFLSSCLHFDDKSTRDPNVTILYLNIWLYNLYYFKEDTFKKLQKKFASSQ